jgi:hypothetical protein
MLSMVCTTHIPYVDFLHKATNLAVASSGFVNKKLKNFSGL